MLTYNAGVVNGAAYSSQSVFCPSHVHILPYATALAEDGVVFSIHADLTHVGKINHKTPLNRGAAAGGMASSLDGNGGIVANGPFDCGGNILRGLNQGHGSLDE